MKKKTDFGELLNGYYTLIIVVWLVAAYLTILAYQIGKDE